MRPAAGYSLRYNEMRGPMHRHLRKMRDTKHLMVPRHQPQLGAHRVSHLTTDVRVNLVEHEDRDPVVSGQHGLRGEHHTRYLAARSYRAQRPHRFTGVRRESELDLVQPRRTRLNLTERHVKRTMPEPQLLELAGDGLRQLLRDTPAVGRQLSARRRETLPQLAQQDIQLGQPLLPRAELVQAFLRIRKERQDFRDRRTVLPFQAVKQSHAILDRPQTRRIAVNPLRAVRQAA